MRVVFLNLVNYLYLCYLEKADARLGEACNTAFPRLERPVVEPG